VLSSPEARRGVFERLPLFLVPKRKRSGPAVPPKTGFGHRERGVRRKGGKRADPDFFYSSAATQEKKKGGREPERVEFDGVIAVGPPFSRFSSQKEEWHRNVSADPQTLGGERGKGPAPGLVFKNP